VEIRLLEDKAESKDIIEIQQKIKELRCIEIMINNTIILKIPP